MHQNVGQSETAAPAESSSRWASKYTVEPVPLGRGSFATVHKGYNRNTGEKVAIKVMTKNRLGEKALQMLSAEINILRKLEHPNVVCLRDSLTTDRRMLIVLEYCGGGDLGQFIQSFGPSPESIARHFMAQLAKGLAFLRSRRLIHRDIKPQNLLLSENSATADLKIADFGLARHLPQGSLAESMLGSPLYMAPEVLTNRAYDGKADLWSAGAVLYELLTAKHPFSGANQTELISNIRRNRPRLPPGISLSSACTELLGMLLVPRPKDRAPLEAFLSCAFLRFDESGSHKQRTTDATDAAALPTARGPELTLNLPSPASLESSSNGKVDSSQGGMRSSRPPESRRDSALSRSQGEVQNVYVGADVVDNRQSKAHNECVSQCSGEGNQQDSGWLWEHGGGAPWEGDRQDVAGAAAKEKISLPALPKLPDVFEPLRFPRSPADVLVKSGDANAPLSSALVPDFAFDLAFAPHNSPTHGSRSGAGPSQTSRYAPGAEECVASMAPPTSRGADVSRRKGREGDARVSHSIEDGRSNGEIKGQSKEVGTISPEPVFYLGKEGAVRTPKASPTRDFMLPDDTRDASVGGDAIQPGVPSSPPVGNDGEDRKAGVIVAGVAEDRNKTLSINRQTPRSSHDRQSTTMPQAQATHESHKTTDTRGGANGTPLISKYPSLRSAGDSLLTIPEDSTGFVLVAKTSSISCEHGPNCECWAWSATGGGQVATVRSPSASYLTSANPYAGPGKKTTTSNAGRRRSSPTTPSFLGLGNIWTTAVNTFRGVAGSHSRRASWSRRGAPIRTTKVDSPTNTPGTPGTAVTSPCDHLSPLNVEHRKRFDSGEIRSPASDRIRTDRNGESPDRKGHLIGFPSEEGTVPTIALNQAVRHLEFKSHESRSPQPTGIAAPARQSMRQEMAEWQHQRRHSDSSVRHRHGGATGGRLCVAGQVDVPDLARVANMGSNMSTRKALLPQENAWETGGGWDQRLDTEAGIQRRITAVVNKAETAGKRAILVVTLADKAAQEALTLPLQSSPDESTTLPLAAPSQDEGLGGKAASVRKRRHEMLTEALALYVKALAILQKTLPNVLSECDIAPSDGSGVHSRREKEVVCTDVHESWNTGALRADLATKASWLKGLFSQTLQRAEHCRTQAAVANPVPNDDACPHSPGRLNRTAASDAAAVAVYTSAIAQGKEGAVCYLLGKTEAAVRHYDQACAFLRLLALEPEMSRAGAVVDQDAKLPITGKHGQEMCGAKTGGSSQTFGGWQTRLLDLAQQYAQRAHVISQAGADGRMEDIARDKQGPTDENTKRVHATNDVSGDGGGSAMVHK